MLIVSLTGGIATGKSVVAGVFEELGCYIHHADRVAHQLMEPEQPAWKKIIDHFGPSILREDKTIDRKKIGALVFSDKKERLFLNELLHPLVFQQRSHEIDRLRGERHFKVFISEAALTIEAGYASFFDRVVLTFCSENIQIDRLMDRDQMDRDEALKRIKSQLPPKKKIKFADYVIDTSKSLFQTVEETEKVFRSLIADYELLYGRF
jgi:dephospho-CoA kinase